ncbi:unnamed protein product, partial [Vitis vinifera]
MGKRDGFEVWLFSGRYNYRIINTMQRLEIHQFQPRKERLCRCCPYNTIAVINTTQEMV